MKHNINSTVNILVTKLGDDSVEKCLFSNFSKGSVKLAPNVITVDDSPGDKAAGA
jgi:hypothetical protein